jgi:hypothetical protein
MTHFPLNCRIWHDRPTSWPPPRFSNVNTSPWSSIFWLLLRCLRSQCRPLTVCAASVAKANVFVALKREIVGQGQVRPSYPNCIISRKRVISRKRKETFHPNLLPRIPLGSTTQITPRDQRVTTLQILLNTNVFSYMYMQLYISTK